MLELEGLSRRFGDLTALDGVSFSVAPGQIFGFVGPNGAGKTTTMRIVLGVLEPDAGTPSRQLLGMMRRGLRLDLRTALREAVETRRPAVRPRVEVEIEGRMQAVGLTVTPLPGSDGAEPLFVVLFTDLGPTVPAGAAAEHAVSEGETVPMELFERELRDTRERLQSAEDRERFDDTTKCILCAACTTSCPVFWTDEAYFGPAAIVNAHRFIFDSRDEGAEERLEILNEKEGVWRCRTTFNCTDACPRGIEVTKAIQEVKKALITRRF